jgi:hypothetical protein
MEGLASRPAGPFDFAQGRLARTPVAPSFNTTLRTLGSGMDVAVHLCRPLQKAPKAGPLDPHKFPEFEEPDLGHFDSSEGFHSPQEIGAAPRGNPMTASGIPEEAQHWPHGLLV